MTDHSGVVYCVFDSETTGFLAKGAGPDHKDQPYLIQLGALLVEEDKVLETMDLILYWPGVTIPEGAAKIHGITTERMVAEGVKPLDALKAFDALMRKCDAVVGYNLEYDEMVALAAFHRVGGKGGTLRAKRKICAMQSATDVCCIPKKGKGPSLDYKYPSLQEAYKKLVDPKGFKEAHTALADAAATHKVFHALVRMDAQLKYSPKTNTAIDGRTAQPAAPEIAPEQFVWLDDLLGRAQDDERISDWEREFVTDYIGKREQYGSRVNISSKQHTILTRIEEKINA